ncbi:MAG: DUF1800 domain-containing protein [Xanthomonadaceae bacterium]|nr:DUF1800 domain-containing protein [Xanthomonadaceae bacterium]
MFAAIWILGLAVPVAAQTPLSHFPDTIFHDGYNGLSAAGTSNISAADASRFLAQATFGPTDADIASLRTLGYQGWLNQQFAATPTYETTDLPGKPNSAYLNWISNVLHEQIGQNNRQEAWFLGALGGPDPQNNSMIHTDQLRQRVAFALSEIFVISDQNATLSGYPQGMAWMYDLLVKDAFGNYRTLLNDVTLSPAMGVYLNMVGNQRANSAMNIHPDENYAREINQLFSIGLVMLNADGTPQLSGGKTIPTYTQSTITNFAHVFTGWNWADCDSNGNDNFQYCGPDQGGSGNPSYGANFLTPMVAYDQTNPLYPSVYAVSYHDNGTNLPDDIQNKQLLSYPGAAMSSGETSPGMLGPGGTAASDLAFALDNIFNHPNVAPFVSRQLIMRLVTSNPSPAYVARVAAVFNANRSSATQLQAVVQAILLDPEARYGEFWNPTAFGKLREPLLVVTHFWRAMGARHECGQNVSASGNSAATNYANQPYRYAGYSSAWATNDNQYGVGVDQASLDAPTVFNFFKPSFMPPGEMTSLGLVGPEFQISTDSIIANSSNTTENRAYNLDISDTCSSGDTFGDVKINHAQDAALAGIANGGLSDPATALIAEYNTRFMSGQMSPFMQQQLHNAVDVIDSTYGPDWKTQRIDRALYLISISPEYMIQK